MDIIIITLLSINLLILLILLLKGKKKDNSDIVERMGKLETTVTKDIYDFKYDFSKELNNDFKSLNDNIMNSLIRINNKVNENLDDNFKRTNETFNNILMRLSKIDEAQKRIDNLSMDIVSLEQVLTDKKTRGIFGEVSLSYILSNVFGNNKNIYELQKTLRNGYIVDCMLYAPEPLGNLCIDSKFPLENYRRMVDKNTTKEERAYYTKMFKQDVKKHIDAIKNKYIIKGETSSEALMFLPAEAIFAEINAYHSDLITYAYQNNVYITSPTTLLSTLTTINMILMTMRREKYAKVITEELNMLSIEFDRYKERWDKLAKNIDTVSRDVKEINATSDKIQKRFNNINNANIEEDKYIE